MYEQLHDFSNLYKSYSLAKKGKRWKNATNQFEMNALESIIYLQHLLQTKQYKMSGYNVFMIYEPKKRIIKSIPFHDKVVQHTLCDICLEPIFEKHFIHDNYASRKGKGVHAGVNRTKQFMREHYRRYGIDGWVLKCDIEKYFDSIDHDVLKVQIRKLIDDVDIIWLLDMIIDSTKNPGLPIGNQTSQLFALIYMSAFDHYIKEKLQIKHYIRYMDDFVLFHPDKEYLRYCKRQIEYLLDDLKLKLNQKSHIFPLKNGVDFLGFHFYLTETRKVIMKVRRDSKKRMKRKLDKFKELYIAGKISKEKIDQSFESWVAHVSHGDCYHLIQDMTKRYNAIFKGDGKNAKSNNGATGRGKSKRPQ